MHALTKARRLAVTISMPFRTGSGSSRMCRSTASSPTAWEAHMNGEYSVTTTRASRPTALTMPSTASSCGAKNASP